MYLCSSVDLVLTFVLNSAVTLGLHHRPQRDGQKSNGYKTMQLNKTTSCTQFCQTRHQRYASLMEILNMTFSRCQLNLNTAVA